MLKGNANGNYRDLQAYVHQVGKNKNLRKPSIWWQYKALSAKSKIYCDSAISLVGGKHIIETMGT